MCGRGGRTPAVQRMVKVPSRALVALFRCWAIMACTTACFAVAAPVRQASGLRAAAPLRPRVARKGLRVQAAVQFDYPTKVFEKELVK